MPIPAASELLPYIGTSAGGGVLGTLGLLWIKQNIFGKSSANGDMAKFSTIIEDLKIKNAILEQRESCMDRVEGKVETVKKEIIAHIDSKFKGTG